MIQVGPHRSDKAGPGDVSGALMEMIPATLKVVPALCFYFKLHIFTRHTPLKG